MGSALDIRRAGLDSTELVAGRTGPKSQAVFAMVFSAGAVPRLVWKMNIEHRTFNIELKRWTSNIERPTSNIE